MPSLAGGGVERVILTLLRHLDREKFELHLAVLWASGEFVDDVPEDVKLHDLHSSRLRYALPGLVRLIWKLRPNTVLSTMAYINLLLIMARPLLPRGTRLLVREAGVVRCEIQDTVQYPRLWKWLYRHVYWRADRVVCQSDWMLKDFVEYFKLPREKLVRIYNPVDTERVQRWAEIGGNPYSGDGPHLVAAGWLRRVKGFDVLIKAMPAVRARLPHVRLTILGQGPLQLELAEQARRLGVAEVVRFAGHQRNPWRWFRHAGAFVLSSRHENLSNAVLEALALGTPVIAADCPGGMKEVQAVSKGMIVVPPEDPNALAEAIVKVCTQPRVSRDHGPAKFDLQRALVEYSSLLSS